MLDSETIQIDDWVLRVRVPEGTGPFPVILLLHGWTGDENSMWVFTQAFPEDFLLLSPRAPHESPLGGYSWSVPKDSWPDLDDFRPAVSALLDLMDNWPAFGAPAADFSNLRLAGFSQGAALTYALGLIHPERVKAIAGLAGFLPEGSANEFSGHSLAGLPVFVTHGTRDDIVPIERARQAVQFFNQLGGEVTYCESDASHKLSADCFKGMEAFFKL